MSSAEEIEKQIGLFGEMNDIVLHCVFGHRIKPQPLEPVSYMST